MKSTDLRAKARAIFGPANPEPMPNQPNGAAALQKRANARPIPTYKVGGVVKKADGGMMKPKVSAAERKMGDALMMTRKGKEIMAAQKGMEYEKEMQRRKKQEAADKLLGIKMKSGGKACSAYKDGGKVQTSSDTARKLAKEMGGMKKGGKAKDGLAVMIAIGKTKPIKEKATGEMYASKAAMKKHEAKETPAMQRAERKMNGGAANVRDTDYEGSKVTRAMKMAVGGAGKTRKGMAPIKKAQGGAAKVRKGMMSPTGDIKQVVKPKKGIGF